MVDFIALFGNFWVSKVLPSWFRNVWACGVFGSGWVFRLDWKRACGFYVKRGIALDFDFGSIIYFKKGSDKKYYK